MEKYIKLSDALKVCRKWNKACFESNDAKGQRCAESIEDEILELPGGVVGAFPYVEKVEVILKENSVGLKVRLSNGVCYGVFRSNGKLKVDGSLSDERMVARKRKCLECGHILFTVEAQNDGASDVYKKLANQKSLKEYYDRKEKKRGAE